MKRPNFFNICLLALALGSVLGSTIAYAGQAVTIVNRATQSGQAVPIVNQAAPVPGQAIPIVNLTAPPQGQAIPIVN